MLINVPPRCLLSAGSAPALPLQTVNQIYWTQEVEEAFEAMAAGDKGLLKASLLVQLGLLGLLKATCGQHSARLLAVQQHPPCPAGLLNVLLLTGIQREAGAAAHAPD